MQTEPVADRHHCKSPCSKRLEVMKTLLVYLCWMCLEQCKLKAVKGEEQHGLRARKKALTCWWQNELLELHLEYVVLQVPGGSCSGLQPYMSSLKLTFQFHGETVAMAIHPECPCEQHAPVGEQLTSALDSCAAQRVILQPGSFLN